MAQTVIFPASHGRTLSAALYSLDGATLIASASAVTEQTALGVYAATFTGVTPGTYLLSAFDTLPANVCDVHISSGSGIFQTADLGEYAIAASESSNLGPGADACVLWFIENGVPAVGGQVWLTSDQAGTTVVAGTLYTDSNGKVTFMLTVGNVYYIWFVCPGFQSIQGQPYTAAAG